MESTPRQFKFSPKNVLERVGEIGTACAIIRKYIADCRKKHVAVSHTNQTYDKIAYYTFMVAIHNDVIRAMLEQTEVNKPATVLANGTKLEW